MNHVTDWNVVVNALMIKKVEDENPESNWLKEVKNSVEVYVVSIIESESKIPCYGIYDIKHREFRSCLI